MKTFGQMALVISVVCPAIVINSTIAKEDFCSEADHYLSYPFDSSASFANLDGVTLDDELFASPEDFSIVNATRLLNPAIKWHYGRVDPKRPKTHYLALSLEPDDGILNFSNISGVKVFNQFGTNEINIPGDLVLDDDGNPGLTLLVPSVKRACPNGNCAIELEAGGKCSPEGDNYLCYELNVLGECLVDAVFKDQFTQRSVDQLLPKRLCNPVAILPNGISLLANDERNHLLCYEVSSRSIPNKLVDLLNRFGIQRGLVRTNDEVCVPSSEVVVGICGNGIVEAGEQCDDGNQTPLDGCETNCAFTDLCPDDPLKLAPGICGCGTSDIDSDNDGIEDCNDGCPSDADLSPPKLCGCIVPNTTPRFLDPSGNDNANDCTDKNNPCLTINHALSQANANDALILAAGTFNTGGTVLLNQSINFFGQGPSVTTVAGNGAIRVFNIPFNSTVDVSVYFCGFTITDGFDAGPLNNLNSGGGAIYNFESVTINDCLITGNLALAIGGAIQNNGSLTLMNSTVSGNLSNNIAGGISNGGLASITKSTVSGNIGNNAAGGLINQGSLTITNSTISGNSSGFGGGIYSSLGITTVDNSTISKNIALLAGGGIYNQSTITLNHTIIADQAGGGDCSGGTTSLGYNLDKDGSCGLAMVGDQTVGTFTLSPLANNGGPTQTHALIPLGAGNEAIDTGNIMCGVTEDQRSLPRPVNINCDIGSFEVQP